MDDLIVRKLYNAACASMTGDFTKIQLMSGTDTKTEICTRFLLACKIVQLDDWAGIERALNP